MSAAPGLGTAMWEVFAVKAAASPVCPHQARANHPMTASGLALGSLEARVQPPQNFSMVDPQ